MKKKIIIALTVLVVLVVAAAVIAITNANSLIQKFKPELERVASDALGNTVKLGELKASVFPDAKIDVSEVKVGGTAQGQSAFTLHNLQLSISLIPLLSKSLDIVELKIDQPSIEIIKDKNKLSIAGLSKPEQTSHSASNRDAEPKKAKSETSSTSGLAINLKRLSITNATLKLHDLETSKDYALTDLSLKASLALSGQTVNVPDVNASGKLAGQTAIGLDGTNIMFALDTGAIDAKNLDLKILGSTINLKSAYNSKSHIGSIQASSNGINLSKLPELAALVPALKELAVSGSVKPNLSVEVSGDSVKGTGKLELVGIGIKTQAAKISDLAGTAPISFDKLSQVISSDDINMSLNGTALKFKFKAAKSGEDIKAESFIITGFSGSISGDAAYNTKASLFGLNSSADNLNIEQMLGALTPGKPAVLSGTLEKVSLRVDGNAQNPKDSVSGPASVRVVNGLLKGINVAADVLKKADNIPFLSGALYGVVPDQYKKDLESPDTPIKSLAADCRLGGGGMDCSGVNLESTLFSLSASGRLNFDSSINLKASIAFAQPLSAGIAAKVKQLNEILDDQGRLVIPLDISGSPSKIHIKPDVKKLTELGAKGVLKKEAGKLLDRALGGGKGKGLGGLFKF